MGLLDVFNSDEGRMALGLLAAAGPSSQPMSFGQRLAGAMSQHDAYLQHKQAAAAAEQDRQMRMQAQQQQMQMHQFQQDQVQRQIKQQEADSNAMRDAFSQRELPGPTPDGGQLTTQFDPRGMLNGGASPEAVIKAMQLRASMEKPTDERVLKPGEAVFRNGVQAYGLAEKPEAPPEIVKLMKARDAYPPNSQQYKTINAAIIKATTHQPGVNVSYGAPQIGQDAQGNPVFFQPSKDGKTPPAIIHGVTPPAKEMPAALQEKFSNNSVAIQKIDKAIDLIDANPGALGAKNYAPDALIQRIDPNGTEVRALVADIGGQKIHDRSGASTTVGETARLRPYIPAATDPPDVVKTKLRLMRQEYKAIQRALASGASIKQAIGAEPSQGQWGIKPLP